MKKLTDLQPLIIEWAKERNIHLIECAPKQRLKLIEECGELANAILKDNIEEQKDAVGDIFVVLTILSEQTGLDFTFNFIEGNTREIQYLIYGLIGYSFPDWQEESPFDWLNDICLILNLDFTECANLAWNEIKYRKGKTVNGTFIKHV